MKKLRLRMSHTAACELLMRFLRAEAEPADQLPPLVLRNEITSLTFTRPRGGHCVVEAEVVLP